MNCTIEYENKVYNFSRLSDGEGAWFLGNTMVHLELGHYISREARAKGIHEAHNFERFPPKREKSKPVSMGRSTKSKTSDTAVRLRIKV